MTENSPMDEDFPMEEDFPINKAYQVIFSIINSSFLSKSINFYTLTPFYQSNLGDVIYISSRTTYDNLDNDNINYIIEQLNILGYIFELKDVRKELTESNISLTVQDIKVKV